MLKNDQRSDLCAIACGALKNILNFKTFVMRKIELFAINRTTKLLGDHYFAIKKKRIL